jgi:hypothetical protein
MRTFYPATKTPRQGEQQQARVNQKAVFPELNAAAVCARMSVSASSLKGSEGF